MTGAIPAGMMRPTVGNPVDDKWLQATWVALDRGTPLTPTEFLHLFEIAKAEGKRRYAAYLQRFADELAGAVPAHPASCDAEEG